MKPRFGEIWMCNLLERSGSVQSGYRPVFIASNNLNNEHSPTINIIPITSRMSKKKLPIHVYLSRYGDYGLSRPSTMLVEQITTVPADYMQVKLGEIKDDCTLNMIFEAIGIQFPIVSMFAGKSMSAA